MQILSTSPARVFQKVARVAVLGLACLTGCVHVPSPSPDDTLSWEQCTLAIKPRWLFCRTHRITLPQPPPLPPLDPLPSDEYQAKLERYLLLLLLCLSLALGGCVSIPVSPPSVPARCLNTICVA